MTIDVGAPPEVYEQLNEQGYMVSRVPLYETTVEAFCISPFPYPGFSGSQWNPGLNLAQAGELDVELWEYNLRLATGSEYLVAVATSENHRWPQNVGSWQEAHCDDDPYNPEPMGSHPDCMSVWGPGALLTYAFWVRTDETLEKTLLNTTTGAWQTVKDYIVMGGMPTSWNAYYGDDHWGAHGHGDEEAYMDDKAGFLVSQPWGITPEYWEAFEKTVSQSTQRYSTVQKRKIHERPSWMRAQR
ncbi:TPA: hypothetical protein DCW61_02660 [Candidatus Uhrbacteria bacterium]|nr:hypothetical protein [Candidatus Uhrbacteria bacterium]